MAAQQVASQTEQAIRQAEIEKDRLAKEIEKLRQLAGQATEAEFDIASIPILGSELVEAFDPLSPLSRELQLSPWHHNYKSRMPAFDGKANPRKFLTNYERAVFSAGGR